MESTQDVSTRIAPLLQQPENHLDELVGALSQGPRPDRVWMRKPLQVTDPEAFGALCSRVADQVSRLLERPEAALREGALRVLQVVPCATGVESALAALGDSSPLVRAAAADVLGQAQAKRAVTALAGCLSDANGDVRLRSASALGAIADGDSVVAMARRWRVEPEPMIRAVLLQSMGETQSDRALPYLLTAIRDPDLSDPELVGTAYGLKYIGDSALAAVLELLPQLKGEPLYAALQVLSVFEQEDVDNTLRAALGDADPVARVHAASGLAQRGHRETIAQLESLTQDESALARAMAAGRLTDLGLASGIGTLLDLYFDPEVSVVSRLALDRMTPALDAEIGAALDVQSHLARMRAAADVAGWRGIPGAVPGLQALGDSEPRELRLAALTSLVRLDAAGAETAFRKDWTSLQDGGERVLATFPLRAQYQPLPISVIDVLLADDAVPVRSAAVEMLAEVDLELALDRLADVLEGALARPDAEIAIEGYPMAATVAASRVFPEFRPLVLPFMDAALLARQRSALTQASEYLRLAVARVLLVLKPPPQAALERLREALRQGLRAELPITRLTSFAALAAVSGGEALDEARFLADDSDELVRFVYQAQRFGHGDAEQAGSALMGDPAPFVRVGAVGLLEDRADATARTQLRLLAADADEVVAQTAADALTRIDSKD